MYGALYSWATSLILLVFTYINIAFPDPAWRTSYRQLQEILSIIRAQLAVVIVSFPIFLIVWNYLLREVRRHPETAKGVLRRWLRIHHVVRDDSSSHEEHPHLRGPERQPERVGFVTEDVAAREVGDRGGSG